MSVFNEYLKKSLLFEGIDISNVNYKASEEYKKIKDQRILGCEGGSMSYEEYIERNLLPMNDMKVFDVYKSKYDMGSKYEFDSDECEDIEVAKEIIVLEKLAEENDIDVEANEFIKKFYRSGGLIERLKKYLGLDLETFECKDKRYKYERCKILYFIYMLEHHYIPNVNVLMLLSKPSMENIDNYYMETFNGETIRLIKNSLEKELDLSVKGKIRTCVEKIVRDWEQALDNARMLADFFYMRELEYDFEETIHVLSDTKFTKAQSISKYTFSPIETLYLKVVQHEYLGNILDIDKINNIKKGCNYNVPQKLIEEMKQLYHKPVDFKNIEQYIEDNARELSKYVYLNENVSKEYVRRIKTFKSKIPKLINFCFRARPLLNIKDISNELQLISMLQAIILDDSSEIFDYTYYGYQSNSTHKKRVQAALKNEDYVPHALQAYWGRKITDHWYANLERYDERVKLRKLEQACDSILIEILRKPNLDEMSETHKYYYMERLDDGLITTERQIQAVERFEKDLRDKGFEYVDYYCLIRYAFLYPPEIEGTYEELIGMIDITINDSAPFLEIELESSSAGGDEKLKVNFRLDFDYARNKCTMGGLNITELDLV